MDSGQWTMNASQSSSFKLSYLLTNICVHFLVCFCQQQDAFRIPSNYISMSCLKEYIILVNHHQSIFPPSSPPFAFFFFLNSSLRTQLERWAENLKVNSSLLLKLNSFTALKVNSSPSFESQLFHSINWLLHNLMHSCLSLVPYSDCVHARKAKEQVV